MATKKFLPSASSLTPKRQALQALAYSRAAIEKLELFLSKAPDDAVPAWVLTRINQGASSLGLAVSFVIHKEKRTEEDKS